MLQARPRVMQKPRKYLNQDGRDRPDPTMQYRGVADFQVQRKAVVRERIDKVRVYIKVGRASEDIDV